MSKTYNIMVGLHFTVCILAMVWPGALIANRIEPIILGMPFMIFWYILWMGLLFIGSWVAFTVRHRGGRDD